MVAANVTAPIGEGLAIPLAIDSWAAQAAFDARPRRDRDACANVFDAMESIAKKLPSGGEQLIRTATASMAQRGVRNPPVTAMLAP